MIAQFASFLAFVILKTTKNPVFAVTLGRFHCPILKSKRRATEARNGDDPGTCQCFDMFGFLKKHYLLPENSPSFGFTLIELLVVIAIIAILAVVVVLVLNPAQLLAQARDAQRVSDMATLNSALGVYQIDQSGASGSFLGFASMDYVSVPDVSSTACADLGFSPAPLGWNYACGTPASYRSVSSSGWIPVNFQNISAGAPFSSIPVDPTNQTSSGLYYSYVTDGSRYEVTAAMESQKYGAGGSGDVVSTDGGSNVNLLEKGTALSLAPLDYGHAQGLVGYWPLNEGTGSAAYDLSGNGNIGQWFGSPSGISGYYSTGRDGQWAGTFNGGTDYVLTNLSATKFPVSAGTITFWMNASTSVGSPWYDVLGNADVYYHKNGVYFRLTSAGNYISFVISDASGDTSVAAGSLLSGWNFIAGTWNGSVVTLSINGSSYTTSTQTYAPFYQYAFNIGADGSHDYSTWYDGLLSDVRVYNRALSAGEIRAIYNGGK